MSTSRESLDEQSQLAGQRFERALTADLVPDTASVMPEEPAFQMPASKVGHGVMHKCNLELQQTGTYTGSIHVSAMHLDLNGGQEMFSDQRGTCHG